MQNYYLFEFYYDLIKDDKRERFNENILCSLKICAEYAHNQWILYKKKLNEIICINFKTFKTFFVQSF